MSRFSSRKFLHSQLCLTLPYPITKFTDKTIIVTGSNTGLGLEAARHFVRLDAARVILAVRSIERGKAAAKSIEESTHRSGVVDVWEMDLNSYASVQTFSDRVNKELDLLHVVVENAGILTYNFNMSEEDERQITVNVVSTMLLALLLLPKLRETAAKINGKTVLTFTGYWMHLLTKFPEHKAENVFKELARKESARMMDRYQISKLLGLFFSRELADLTRVSEKGHYIVINNVNPGAVITDIVRNPEGLRRIYAPITQKLFCRPTEEGSRTLVHGAEGAEETHGQYLDDCKVGVPSAFVLSEEGVQTQKKMWRELEEKLERIYPGIMQNI